ARRGFHIIEVTGVQQGVSYKGKAMLVSTGPSGPGDRRSQEAREEDANTKLAKVLAELKSGKPFSEVARAQSDDTATKSRGGDLGSFGRRRLGKEVDSVLEKAKVGEVTPPIKSARGYWLVLLEDRSMVPSEDRKTVRHILLSSDYDDIKRSKLEGKLDAMAKTRADELLARIKGGEDFAKVASEASEDAYTRKTGGEYKNYRSTSLGPEVWQAVQTMKANAEPQIVKSNRGYHIVQVIEKDKTEFDTVKGELLAELNKQPVSPGEVRELMTSLKEKATIDRKIGAQPPKDDDKGASKGAGDKGGDKGGAKAVKAPADKVPADKVPADKAPAGKAPTGKTPTGKAPASAPADKP
ncbi:MAG: peptidylprolyl isomerase, partial [Myxococcota bacterium]